MNGQNKSTGSESDTIHELRKQYNDLKKKFGDLKEINEELKEEIGMLRRPRWLDDLKRDAALRNDVFTFAWYQFSQRELSEIVDAKSLFEALWKIDSGCVKKIFDGKEKEKADGADKSSDSGGGRERGSSAKNVEKMPLYWTLDSLIQIFVEIQWRLDLASAQKKDLFFKTAGGRDGFLKGFGGFDKIVKVKNNASIGFDDGVRLIVRSSDYSANFGFERSGRYAAFPMPDPEFFPTDLDSFAVPKREVSNVSSDGDGIDGNVVLEKTEREGDLVVLFATQKKKDVFWRFFWYRYCEEVYFSWMFRGGGGGRSLVLSLVSRCDIGEGFNQSLGVSLDDPDRNAQMMSRYVQWLFYILVKKGFLGSDIEDWFIAFQQWAENQRALANARAGAAKGGVVDDGDFGLEDG